LALRISLQESAFGTDIYRTINGIDHQQPLIGSGNKRSGGKDQRLGNNNGLSSQHASPRYQYNNHQRDGAIQNNNLVDHYYHRNKKEDHEFTSNTGASSNNFYSRSPNPPIVPTKRHTLTPQSMVNRNTKKTFLSRFF